MVARTILTWPNKLLRNKSSSIGKENCDILFRDLLDTLKVNFAIGVAAPQINEHRRACLIKGDSIPSFEQEESLEGCVAFIDPVIEVIDKSQVKSREACLSVPGLVEVVDRYKGIKVSYTDISSKRKSVTVFNSEACILQHEIDHLDGVLFIDRLPPIKKMILNKKVKKQTLAAKKNTKISKEKASKLKSAATRKKNREKRKKAKRK